MNLNELPVELKGQDIIHARLVERDVLEGRCHNEPASVVQLLGVKPLKHGKMKTFTVVCIKLYLFCVSHIVEKVDERCAHAV